MAFYTLSRNPSSMAAPDNITQSGLAQYRWISLTYGAVTGAQDVVFLPDSEECGLQVFIVGGFTYSVEATMDPPANVTAGTASWTVLTGWSGLTTSSTSSLVGPTAIRLNPSIAGTSIKINVRA